MTNPNVPLSFQLTNNPAIDGLILRGLMWAAGLAAGVIVTWLNAHGFVDPNLKLMITGGLLSLLTAVAALIYGFVLSKINQAKAVQAGINLTVSGNALAADGKTVVGANDGTTPPLPVSAATAAQIVKDFAVPSKI